MAYVPNNTSFQGLFNFIVSIEVALYNKPLCKEDITLHGNCYTLYLVDMGHEKLRWEPYQCISDLGSTQIFSTKDVIQTACNRLNNLKEHYATQQI